MPRSPSIPVIDLFAGPGGLGEGFSAYRTVHADQPFRVALSIEKDTQAHSTLQLRSFVRQFGDDIPRAYYAFLADTETPLSKRIESLFDEYPAEARAACNEAWLAELGDENRATVRERIATALGDNDPWVLLGGPPCQAYSLAGRSRNKGNADYVAEEDGRQVLYVEYLQVIADHQPAVFVMENVKGLL
ncbi:MAG: DNA cytosine methyltransferase, partial [Phycisphaeraceae bacterium]|nr:DNA cytosine methyltransferase [Phycisphaeraceae bacterium]